MLWSQDFQSGGTRQRWGHTTTATGKISSPHLTPALYGQCQNGCVEWQPKSVAHGHKIIVVTAIKLAHSKPCVFKAAPETSLHASLPALTIQPRRAHSSTPLNTSNQRKEHRTGVTGGKMKRVPPKGMTRVLGN